MIHNDLLPLSIIYLFIYLNNINANLKIPEMRAHIVGVVAQLQTHCLALHVALTLAGTRSGNKMVVQETTDKQVYKQCTVAYKRGHQAALTARGRSSSTR